MDAAAVMKEHWPLRILQPWRIESTGELSWCPVAGPQSQLMIDQLWYDSEPCILRLCIGEETNQKMRVSKCKNGGCKLIAD